MKNQPYITMISNRIEVMMHNTDMDYKYPGGIHTVHMQNEKTGDVEFEFSHNGEKITDKADRQILTTIFYELVGETFE